MTAGVVRWAARGMAAAFSVFGVLAALAGTGPMPQAFELSNGMRVVVIEDRRAPVVTNMVWYKAGAADEKPGKSGIAHFLEHLMFTGTKKFPDGEFDKLITRQGGENNAFTTHDVTVYHENVGRDRLELMIELEADRMTGLILDDARVAKERDVILEERNTSIDNQPGEKLREQMNAAMFANHRYGIEVLGWRHEMERLTLADAMEWYRTHYAPSNAILVVAGDVGAAEVKVLAEKHFGPIPGREITPRRRAKEPEPIAARRVELRDAQVTQPELRRYYLAPSYTSGPKDIGYALDLFADALGGRTTSILYKELVQNQRLAVDVSVSYDGSALDDSTLEISATPAPGVELAKLEAALDRLLTKALAAGISEKDLQRSKTRLRAAAVFQRDDRESLAQAYGSGLAAGESLAEIHAWPEKITTIPKSSVDAAARSVIKPERSVTGLLLPELGDRP